MRCQCDNRQILEQFHSDSMRKPPGRKCFHFSIYFLIEPTHWGDRLWSCKPFFFFQGHLKLASEVSLKCVLVLRNGPVRPCKKVKRGALFRGPRRKSAHLSIPFYTRILALNVTFSDFSDTAQGNSSPGKSQIFWKYFASVFVRALERRAPYMAWRARAWQAVVFQRNTKEQRLQRRLAKTDYLSVAGFSSKLGKARTVNRCHFFVALLARPRWRKGPAATIKWPCLPFHKKAGRHGPCLFLIAMKCIRWPRWEAKAIHQGCTLLRAA